MSPVEYINDSYAIVVPGHIDFRRTKCMFTQSFVTFQKADNVTTRDFRNYRLAFSADIFFYDQIEHKEISTTLR